MDNAIPHDKNNQLTCNGISFVDIRVFPDYTNAFPESVIPIAFL